MNPAEDAWIGLGSNLGDPVARVRAGFEALADVPGTDLVGRSPLYGSAPMGPPDQPDYVNAVAHLRTTLEPHALLDELQRIEFAAGRRRNGRRWGARELDLDLLAQGGRRLADERLTLPHPGAGDRPFVLRPLADLAPDLEIPGMGRVRELLGRVGEAGLWPIASEPSESGPARSEPGPS